MAKHRLSLPPAEWPADLRQRVEKARLTAHQRPRIEQGLGRWLLAAREEGRPADEVTQDLWLARSTGLRQELRNAMRQALALAFPGSKEALYATQRAPAIRRNPRDDLVQVIRRNLGRFPAAWRAAAEPLMTVDPDGIADGLLIQAWSPATIKRRLEAAALHFDACREAGLAAGVEVEGGGLEPPLDRGRRPCLDQQPVGDAVGVDRHQRLRRRAPCRRKPTEIPPDHLNEVVAGVSPDRRRPLRRVQSLLATRERQRERLAHRVSKLLSQACAPREPEVLRHLVGRPALLARCEEPPAEALLDAGPLMRREARLLDALPQVRRPLGRRKRKPMLGHVTNPCV